MQVIAINPGDWNLPDKTFGLLNPTNYLNFGLNTGPLPITAILPPRLRASRKGTKVKKRWQRKRNALNTRKKGIQCTKEMMCRIDT